MKRIRWPGIEPLEVWDVVVDVTGEDLPLHLVPEPLREKGVAAVVAALREGTARRAEYATPLPALDFDRIVLRGGAGGLMSTGLAIVEAVPGLFVATGGDGTWGAWDGGRHLLEHALEVDPDRGLIVDVGQTSIKRVHGASRDRIERPADALSRDAVVAWIGGALVDGRPDVEARADVSGVVLALPCEVDDDGAVGVCSYPWPSGDRFVEELERAVAPAPLAVLNDAELAAISVDVRMSSPQSTLVLTLGFGLGAALIRR